MLEFADANEILPFNQFEFRKNFSNKDAIFHLFSLIEENKARNLKSCVVFLDLSKAFDMANRCQLLKLLNLWAFVYIFLPLLKVICAIEDFVYIMAIRTLNTCPSTEVCHKVEF